MVTLPWGCPMVYERQPAGRRHALRDPRVRERHQRHAVGAARGGLTLCDALPDGNAGAVDAVRPDPSTAQRIFLNTLDLLSIDQ